MLVCIAISIWLGRWVELSRSLFCYASWREEGFIARRQLSSASGRRRCCLVSSLRLGRAVPGADDFGDAFTEHSECGDEHPEPPDAPRRCEEEGTEGDEEKTNPHEYLCNSVCEGGRAFVFEAVSVPFS